MHRRLNRALGVAALVLFFLSAAAMRQAVGAAADLSPRAQAVLNELRAQPDWLFPADACPADVMPQFEEEIYYLADDCKPHLRTCFDECKSDDANACYALALTVQELDTDDAVAEALFLRSCDLGIPSGCTNRAAGMMTSSPETAELLACTARTFERTCGKDDAWGCTMLGFQQVRGAGVIKDLERAGHSAQKACAIARESEACKYAKALGQMIEDEGGTKPVFP